MMATAKPNSISCACQSSGGSFGVHVIGPSNIASQNGTASAASSVPAM